MAYGEVIDKKANWVVKSDYSSICICHYDPLLYLVRQVHDYGIIKSDGNVVYPWIYSNIDLTDDDVSIKMEDNTISCSKYNGIITREEVYSYVYSLSYYDGYLYRWK